MAIADKIAPDVRRLADEGLGRNAIAVQLGVSAGSVTAAAKVAGVRFDRAQTVVATEAVVRDARASRADLSLRMLAAAHRGLDEFNRAESGRDARDFMTAAAIATDKHALLDALATDSKSLSDVDAWTKAMLGGGETVTFESILAEQGELR